MSAPAWQPTQLVPGPNITGSKTLTDMTVDSNGNLYLVESSADPGRILKYSPGPAMLTAKLDGGADATGLTGTSDVAVNLPLTNLTAGTKYYFRAVATNSGGTANGEVLSFTTVSGDATLKSLALSAGTLTPVFASATTTYTATVPIGTTTLTVTPTVNQTNATLTVNGHAAVSGAAYGPISLAIDDNIITIVVTASDSTTDTYKVTVTRPVGAPVAVSVAVDPTTIRTAEATLLGTLDANGAPSVTGFFQFGTSASISAGADLLPAKEGSAEDPTSPLPVKLRVTNLVSETTYYYRVVGTNDYGTNYGATLSFLTLSTNANLAGLAASVGSLTPAFASGTTDYTVTVSNAPASTTITPTVSQTNATVTVNGTAVVSGAASAPISLVVGDNPITVVVTAQDGLTTRSYTVAVNKLRVPVTFTAQPAGVTVFSEANTTNYITVAASASSWTNVARVAGAAPPVSFQATAWGSDTPLTYQWYQNGAPLAGQTSNVLTVAVDGSTAGAAFQVVATDSSSVTATSTVATLTVEQASTSIAYAFDQAATGHSSTNWQQTGNASWGNDTGGYAAMPKRMRLTGASSSQNSSFWYNLTSLNAGRSWRFSWTFQGGYSSNPADVCSFVLQADGTNAVVIGPGETTVSGLANRFLSIAIDDYKNTYDPSASTLKVTYGTNTSQTQFPIVNLATAFTNSNQAPGLSTTAASPGPPYNLTASYFALSNRLTITLANTIIPGGAPGGTNNPLTYTYTLNLGGLFGTNRAWAGFAGGTGGFSQIHDVLNANGLFSSENNQPPIVVIPITNQPAIYNAAFSFTFPEGTFSDPDGNALSYTATGLPPGILFTSGTRTFAGTPTAVGSYSVSLVASDGQSPPLSATNIFAINVAQAQATVDLSALSQTYSGTGRAATTATT
ncbi:MAG: cadherin-like beta sandwich domain-containing protein, partial [Verrucomicrobiota bacterium]